jgi:metallo-beta-lactamase family protein
MKMTKFNQMKLSFFGAVKEVTGSAHLVELKSGFKILLDCGMYQGDEEESGKKNREWGFEPSEIDCVIMSHSHIDHIGRLPKLVKDGFTGDIYSTPATRSLALIMLLDSAKIQEYDHSFERKKAKKQGRKPSTVSEPLYSTEDVYTTLAQFVTINYERWHKVNEEFSFLLRDAGHILGSASVVIKTKEDNIEKTLGFTGDIGRPSRPILKDPKPLPKVDYLITESTYGNRVHESSPNEYKHLLKIIQETCVQNKGKLIIPAFSLGRTQEIVYMLDQMANKNQLPRIPVYVDSPLSVNATRIYRLHPECYNRELQDYIEFDPDPFGFNGLRYVTEPEESKRINTKPEPCIIISASGMITAGRIRHHLYNHIENPKNTVLIVGFCARGTTGAHLREGAQKVTLFGEEKKVRAKIEIMDSFSAHADKNELIFFLSGLKPELKKLFLVHGEEEVVEEFSKELVKEGFKGIEIPEKGKTYEL